MLILTLKTDQPLAELALYEDTAIITSLSWEAHRQLAETIHQKINELLEAKSKQLTDVGGIVLFKGPGSFTGLRIGASVANALAGSLGIPIIGTMGTDWQSQGSERLVSGKNDQIVVPEYGSEPLTTQQKR